MTGGVFTGRRNVQAKHPDRQVIASVPTGIAWFSLTMLAAALAFAPYALYDYLIDSEPGLYKRHYTIALVLAAIVAVPFFLRYARHLFSGHRHMIWVEAGEVIFLDREHFAVRCSDIADIKPDFDDRGYAVIVFAILSGWLFWNELPDLTQFIGITVLSAAGLYTYYRERKLYMERESLITA